MQLSRFLLVFLCLILGSESFFHRGSANKFKITQSAPIQNHRPCGTCHAFKDGSVEEVRRFKSSVTVQSLSLFSFLYFHTRIMSKEVIMFKLPVLREMQLPADSALGLAVFLVAICYRQFPNQNRSSVGQQYHTVPWRRARVRPIRSFIALLLIAIQFQIAGVISVYLPMVLDIMVPTSFNYYLLFFPNRVDFSPRRISFLLPYLCRMLLP